MKVLIIGAGMMAKSASYDFVNNKTVSEIKIVSHNIKGPTILKNGLNSKKVKIGVVNAAGDLSKVMQGYDVVMSCVPYKFNYNLAKSAVKAKTNFIDLGGNNTVVEKELSLDKKAKKAKILIVPDCGLAPGLTSVLAKLLIDEGCSEIHLRVGGLPLKPKNPPLNYELVFSVKGLINEYREPAIVIRNYKQMRIDSLGENEKIKFSKQYTEMEAFTTSGGTSTLPKTYEGKIKELDYKTVRYKGHLKEMKKLMREYPSFQKLEKKLLKIVPRGSKDIILIRAWGIKNNKKIEYNIIEKFDSKTGLTAMMKMTSYPATILASLIGNGEISSKGALTQEHFVPAKRILQELKKRGIKVSLSKCSTPL